ncbi:MAG: hypothetical protein LH478_09000 [Chitinophagaceae bacterium]|nr:hypothetical protein [Chitinophagaceae bacterium]
MEDEKDYMVNNDEVPHMNSLALCVNKMVLDGYTDDFKVVNTGLKSLKTEKIYNPGEIHVKNFFRFEGQSDPNDNTIMYVIETNDGLKGTLVDAYGPYADAKVSEFMQQVDSFEKKVTKAEA